MENTPIENQAIKGVTAKSLAWFFGGIITVVITVIGAFNSYDNKITALQTELKEVRSEIENIKEGNKKRDLSIETNTIKNQSLELQNVRLEEQLKRR